MANTTCLSVICLFEVALINTVDVSVRKINTCLSNFYILNTVRFDEGE